MLDLDGMAADFSACVSRAFQHFHTMKVTS